MEIQSFKIIQDFKKRGVSFFFFFSFFFFAQYINGVIRLHTKTVFYGLHPKITKGLMVDLL